MVGEYVEGELIIHEDNKDATSDENPYGANLTAGTSRRSGEPETGNILEPLNEEANEN